MKMYDERLFQIARMDTYAHYISDSTCNSVCERAGGGGSVGDIAQGHSTGYEERRCGAHPDIILQCHHRRPRKRGGRRWTSMDPSRDVTSDGIRAEMLSAFTHAIGVRARGRAVAGEGDGFLGGDGGEVRGIEPDRNIRHRASNGNHDDKQFSGRERVPLTHRSN